ncbi:hypothetical protein F0562_009185 [Nyssa sinensis]|uniref:Uncharacterized protein n=1 Tax=Nyssa sinensis TaxID=561372 RepID=A0A5J4ZUZ8_9ASTE|nr:hypothetical protein F0562_009185 [Nyssa sinensis]
MTLNHESRKNWKKLYHPKCISRSDLFTSVASPILSVSEVNATVKDLVLKGLYNQTLKLYKEQLHPSVLLHASITVLPSVIKACTYAQNHHLGLQLHCVAVSTGSDLQPVVSNSLISMYAKFSNIDCARTLFAAMPQRDTITWNSMINCSIQNGYFAESLRIFKEMYVRGFVPKSELIASILSVCGKTKDLRLGREIHALVVIDGRIEDSAFLWTALVDLYMKCNDSLMALRVFDRMEDKNDVSWTSMVSGFAANGDYNNALYCFRAMQLEGIKPNRVTLIAILPVCAVLGSIKHGREIHGYAFRHGFNSEFRFSSALIHVYCKCGEGLRPAKIIFERSTGKDVVMWSSIIASYSQSRETAEEAIKHFHQMQMEGIQPNSVTVLAVVSACTNLSSVNHGRAIHCYILKSGLNSDLFLGNSLIDMYSKCGYLIDSQQIFKEMPVRDCISWSILISSQGLHGCGKEALQLFHEMQEHGVEPDAITYLAIISACNHAGLVEEGKKLFGRALKHNKMLLTIEHYACYIGLLGRAGKIDDACEVVSTMPMKPSTRIWSSLISACKVYERFEVAESLAHRLIKSDPENAANYTLLSMVYAESGVDLDGLPRSISPDWSIPSIKEGGPVRVTSGWKALKKTYASENYQFLSLAVDGNEKELPETVHFRDLSLKEPLFTRELFAHAMENSI